MRVFCSVLLAKSNTRDSVCACIAIVFLASQMEQLQFVVGVELGLFEFLRKYLLKDWDLPGHPSIQSTGNKHKQLRRNP